MGTEAYFRIKNDRKAVLTESEIHNILRRIAVIIEAGGSVHSNTTLIAKESATQDDKMIVSYSSIYESSSGYKYKIGSGNDWRLDETGLFDIYLISYRYGTDEQMQNIVKGICNILPLHYIYNLNLERRIVNEIHPLLVQRILRSANFENLNYDDIFEHSREFVKQYLINNNLTEKDLTSEVRIEKIIQSYLEQIK